MSFFKTTDIGIDLGTASVLIYCKDKGIVLREPSVAAIDRDTGAVVGVGYEAQRMIGRTPSHIEAIRPLRDGVISNDIVTLQMLDLFLRKWTGKKRLGKHRIMVCVPSGVTDVERRAVRRVALDLGAKEVFTIEEPIAAAIGAGMDIAQPYGSLIVDIGGGTADIAVVSMGQCVVSESLKVAGDRMNDAIVRFLRRKHNLLIGERTAELLKINIGTAYPRSETLYTEVMGRNLLTGLPKSIQISSEDIRFAIEEELNLLIQGIHKVLEQTPPELAGDILDSGNLLTGGGSLLFGLDKLFSENFHLNCYVAEDAISCVALGTGMCLDHMDSYDPEMFDY